MQRSASYIGILNTSLVGLIYLNSKGLEISVWLFPLVFLGTAVGIILFGYAEDKLGFHKAEQEAFASRHPVFPTLFKRLDEIERKIDKSLGER